MVAAVVLTAAYLGTMLILYLNPSAEVFEPKLLLPLLNTIFAGILQIVVAIIALRFYLLGGLNSFLFISCGLMTFGVAAILAGWMIGGTQGPNVNVTIYNAGVLLGAIFHALGVVQVLRHETSEISREHKLSKVIWMGTGIIIYLSGITLAALQGATPVFFVQGMGPTVLRQVVLGVSATLFFVSAWYLMRIFSQEQKPFYFWYGLTLTMLGLGLVAAFIQPSVGSPLGWLNRGGHYVAGIYAATAVLATSVYAKKMGVPFSDEMASLFRYAKMNYNRLVEAVIDPIVTTDHEFRILQWNHAAELQFGYSQNEAFGLSLWDLVDSSSNSEIFRNSANELVSVPVDRSSVRSPIEFTGKKKDSARLDMEVFLSAIRVAGRLLLVCEFRDIAERNRLAAVHALTEAQLRESQKMEAIGTLAGGIAHDFNNALATILGNAELARQDSAHNAPALESLEEIRRAATRVRNLVQQILSFSRRRPVERKLVDLAPVVIEVTRLLRATLPARLSLEVQCDQVPLVLVDASQMEQVLLNLATNAMQALHSGAGPGRINLRLDTVILDAALAGTHIALEAMYDRHPVRTVRITLSDNGPGMDTATTERIFEPFFTTKPMGEGTGLGLSVVHGIVHGHEGVITVDSAPGKGSTFTIYLQAAEADADAGTQVLNLGAEASLPAHNMESGLRILYVDDDESLVFLVERLLLRHGYRVAPYTRPEAALQALRADPAAYDMVLTDYSMPGMSGLDVAREARALNPNLPVAVTSGFIDETLRVQAETAGVRNVIFKADDVEVFCESVHRVAQAARQKTSSADL